MRINTNISALNAYRQLTANQTAITKNIEKLSSGFRINRAGDDAAGLAISEKMRAQIRGLTQASRNAQDAISLIQTAEGALNETHSILQRMRELAVQSATDTNTDEDRAEIQKEIDQLATEITRISTDTEFNTQKLLNGDYNGKIFHIGANQKQNISLTIRNMSAVELGVGRAAGESEGPGALPAERYSIEGMDGEFELVADTDYRGIAGQTVLVNPLDESVVAVQIDGNWYDAGQVELQGELGELAAVEEAVPLAEPDEVLVLGGEIVTESEEDFLGVSDTKVLKNGAGVVVAVDVDGNWYDPNEVEEDSGVLKVDLETEALDLQEGLALNGEIVTEETEEYEGFADTTVLKNGEGEVVGVKIDDTWYAPEDVEILGRDAYLGFVDDAEPLNVSPVELGEEEPPAVSVGKGIDVSTQAAADMAITVIDQAIVDVSAERSMIGALQNRLEHTIANLGTSAENLQAAESRIRDLDMAQEIMAFTKNTILQQAATAMLAQANMAPQSVLQLLG